MTALLIGLTGLARSGKTTAAEYLVNRHGFTIVSMADPLKEMAKKLDPIIGVQDMTDGDGELMGGEAIHLSEFLDDDGNFLPSTTEDDVKREWPEYRRVLQKLGTDCIRSHDQDFWIKAFWETIAEKFDRGQERFVVPDVRFMNEAEAIKTGKVWMAPAVRELVYVEREGLVRGAHASEQWAGRMDESGVIENNGTLVELAEQLDTLVERMLR